MIVIKILHYLALIFGFQASAFFTFFLIAEGGANMIEGKPSVLPILSMMIFAVAGYIWALSKPKKGSLVMISGGIIMAIYLLFIGGPGELKMSLIYGLPFIIPGLIFYFTAHKVPELQPEDDLK
jgi:hypothetical protein